MKASMLFPISMILLIFFVLDLYVFRGLMNALYRMSANNLRIIRIGYWIQPIIVVLWLVGMLTLGDMRNPRMFPTFMLFVGFVLLFMLPKLVFISFQSIDDLARFVMWLVRKLGGQSAQTPDLGESRSRFLLQLGLVLSAIPFVSVLDGVFRGRFNFKVVPQELSFPNLPEAFDGLTMLQISDAHLGSFLGNEARVEAAVSLINKQQADLVVFTGDLVNNIAKELDTFESVFGRIEARIGKYSILGNHDYGGYYRWNSIDEKDQNLEDLKQRHKNMGFRLLLNEAVSIEKDGQKIGLIGVENWGLPPFPQFGDLEKAQESVKNLPFQVLLSHDPTHWDEVVCPTTRIDLTLSGHTHGMQFGIGFGKHKWSPVSLKYSKWGGLYSKGKQHLYVNRGFGVIGFPGRIGMDPELTLFTLRKEI